MRGVTGTLPLPSLSTTIREQPPWTKSPVGVVKSCTVCTVASGREDEIKTRLGRLRLLDSGRERGPIVVPSLKVPDGPSPGSLGSPPRSGIW